MLSFIQFLPLWNRKFLQVFWVSQQHQRSWNLFPQSSTISSTETEGDLGHVLHPGRLTWNLRIHHWKRKIIFQTIIFRFYVNLWGCKRKSTEVSVWIFTLLCRDLGICWQSLDLYGFKGSKRQGGGQWKHGWVLPARKKPVGLGFRSLRKMNSLKVRIFLQIHRL